MSGQNKQLGKVLTADAEPVIVNPVSLRSGNRDLRIFNPILGSVVEIDRLAKFKRVARLVFVFAPLFIVSIYLFFIASNRYLSEANFLVRSTSSNAASEITSVVQSQSLARAVDETYVVKDYLQSRDAMQVLVKENDLLAVLRRPEADVVNRFPPLLGKSDRLALYRRYRDMVDVKVDSSTGIVALSVIAFRADDARNIAAALINDAEAFLNRMNLRAERDAVAYAQSFVDEARDQVTAIEQRITAFRNVNGSADPSQEAAQALDTLGSLTGQVAEMRADVEQQSVITPTSPALAARRQQIDALETQIAAQKQKIVGADSSLASKLGQFEQLIVEREIAAKSLDSAISNLDKTRQEAAQKHLYLQVVVSPNTPDRAEYPKRGLGLLITLLVGLGLYSISVSIYSSILEHRP